eukprot:10822153-Alexandrium_andersonii.AAC.1
MLAMRQDQAATIAEGDFVRYFTVDASPVAGREWVNTASTTLSATALAKCWADANYLCCLADKPRNL